VRSHVGLVDADEHALVVDQRAAAVAVVDRHVGLHDLGLEHLGVRHQADAALVRPPHALVAVRLAADGEDALGLAGALLAQRHGHDPVGQRLQLDQRQVAAPVGLAKQAGADGLLAVEGVVGDVGDDLAAVVVGAQHLDLGGVGRGDVLVGQHQLALHVDDLAGAEPARLDEPAVVVLGQPLDADPDDRLEQLVVDLLRRERPGRLELRRQLRVLPFGRPRTPPGVRAGRHRAGAHLGDHLRVGVRLSLGVAGGRDAAEEEPQQQDGGGAAEPDGGTADDQPARRPPGLLRRAGRGVEALLLVDDQAQPMAAPGAKRHPPALDGAGGRCRVALGAGVLEHERLLTAGGRGPGTKTPPRYARVAGATEHQHCRKVMTVSPFNGTATRGQR
jgi:hypothetical protein